MKEFTETDLRNFIANGYRFVLYTNMEHFAILAPLRHECPTSDSSYIISIQDQQCMDMANGVDGFSFYTFD